MAFQALNHASFSIPQEVLKAFADQPKLRDQIAAFICTYANIRTPEKRRVATNNWREQ